jgi:uncharacterized peroxidase-related enzyme
MRAQSLNPNALRVFLDLYVTSMYGRSGLSRAEREMIATAASSRNRCGYCVSHHGEALRFYLKNDAQVELLKRGEFPENASPRTEALLRYALKLNEYPGDVSKEDLEALRIVGITDSEILDLVLVTGYVNLVNRIALGLGVEHDEQESRGYQY